MGLLFAEMAEPQRTFEFQQSLTAKYLPERVSGLVGLSRAKRVLTNILSTPRPMALVFLGDPGRGKTAIAFAFANDLGASVRYIGAQRCTVEELDGAWEAMNHFPPKGNWWVCIVDEADQMTERAQLRWLSKGDLAASLKPVMGGSFEPGKPLPIVWIFTCNQTERFEKRFLTRCMVLDFM